MKTLVTTSALVLALAAGADAANATGSTMLAGGPIYSSNASFAYCWWINLGVATITPTTQVMYPWNSNTTISAANTCPNGSPVGPGTTCYIYPGSSINGLSCEVVFSTSSAKVRGSLELTDGTSNVLSQVELR